MVVPYLARMPNGAVREYGGEATIGQWDGERYIYVLKKRSYKVARLVCEAFHGPAPHGRPTCLHLDEDSRNNVPSNVYWGTQKQNLNFPKFLAYCASRTGENNPAVKGRRAR